MAGETQPARGRAAAWLVLAGIPGSLFTAAATVPMGLAALYALGARLGGRRADPDVARLFAVFAACWAGLLAADLLNGGGLGNFQFTAVNYLPLLGAAGVAYVLRNAAIGDRPVIAALTAAIWIAAAMSLFRSVVLEEVRPGGLNMNPIPYALVVSMWGMLLLSLALDAPRHRWLLVATALVAAVPVALAESKLVWLAGLAGYAVVVVLWSVQRRRWGQLAIALSAGAVLVWVAYATVAAARIDLFFAEIAAFLDTGDLSGDSFGPRLILARAGLRAFLDGPLLGYGFQELLATTMSYIESPGLNVARLTHLHNDYLTHLVAYGYAGLAFLVVFFATLVWLARNAADSARRNAAYALTAMIAIYMAGDIFFNIEPVTGPFAIMVGLLMMRPRQPPDPA